MHADNTTTGHNRTIKITGIPTSHPDEPGEVTIQITYVSRPNEGGVIYKAVALDTHVIPAIVKAINDAK